MEPNILKDQDSVQPLSHPQAILAVLPFLAFGVSSLAAKLDFLRTVPVHLTYWQVLFIHPYLIFNWLNLVGLGAGLLAGFPRWAYSYLGWALLYGWWWSNMGFYGYHMDWKIWLPLLAVGLLALLIRRSLAPLRAMLGGLWRDWTWLSFAFYILYGHVAMVFDENHHPMLLVLILLTSVAVAAGAWGYYRARSSLWRVMSLMGGIVAVILISIYSEATWDRRAYYNLPESSQNGNWPGMVGLAVVLLLIFGSGLLGVWHSRRINKRVQ